MENLKFIEEIKKNKNYNLEDIIRIFIDKKIPKYVAFVLIKTNFNYDEQKIMYYLNLLCKNEEPNPFNEDFINYSEDD
ncbi:hypothetical protein [Chryseobacterium balustinum]|uniref:Uncharacterized protein n=1 Tax=Chryseobacterium balustinum TaxID=246 RepID=A0AAX2IS09_9FLAO|nr:hypothetical protein [Chryseobacterium balustinum]SKC13132.1 hypothetical protein SAMN05421800_14411 [Chryseobacterium balustinum]SQA92553.1 Uncharacterised protein [Chryseobacterium balustinum]